MIAFPNKKTNSYSIPDNVINISEKAFYGCTNLFSIIIPNSITTIGDWAFDDCTNLTSVTFGKSDISINNNNAFPGDLVNKYLSGGVGVYKMTSKNKIWKKQPD